MLKKTNCGFALKKSTTAYDCCTSITTAGHSACPRILAKQRSPTFGEFSMILDTVCVLASDSQCRLTV